ncbi:HdeD family acid-resistance protein [uncultured Massilia sp.]|uniref:HdeD family acid-resistance protein n=1 Tax=uncultured Massilia sp. TaxID=169973 RepID=UPI0025D15C33|nr:DUF308 domain-containing protein [uncultured Massilia sp.]
MEHVLPSWRMLALRGVAAILFAVLCIGWPLLSLMLLIALFAAYALLSGFASLAAGMNRRGSDDGRVAALLLGAVSIGAGLVAMSRPGLTALALVLLMGANALVTGAIDVLLAVRLRTSAARAWLLALAGGTAIAFGAIVFTYPGAGALAMLWLVSLYAFLSGAFLLALALHVRAGARAAQPPALQERRSRQDRRAGPARHA